MSFLRDRREQREISTYEKYLPTVNMISDLAPQIHRKFPSLINCYSGISVLSIATIVLHNKPPQIQGLQVTSICNCSRFYWPAGQFLARLTQWDGWPRMASVTCLAVGRLFRLGSLHISGSWLNVNVSLSDRHPLPNMQQASPAFLLQWGRAPMHDHSLSLRLHHIC